MSGVSLYELAAEYREAIEVLGDMDLPEEAVADTLEGLRGSLEDKALNVMRYVVHLEHVAEGQKEIADKVSERLHARHKATAARAVQLRAYILANMKRASLTEFAADDIAVKRVKNPVKVVIDNDQALHTHWKREVVSYVPDKAAIKEALLNCEHESITGAHLERSERLQVT